MIATYAHDEAAAARFFEESDGPARLHLAKFDVSDHGQVERFFDGLESPPQVVISNAAIEVRD